MSIDKAIQATAPAPVPAASLSVTLSSGRQIAMVMPADLTLREALDLVSFVSGGLGAELDRLRKPASGLVVPAGPLRKV